MADQNEIGRLAERIERLEEGQAFAERAADGLSAEVFSLARRLDELAKRVGRLERAEQEARLASAENAGEDAGDRAPHDGATGQV